MYKIDAHIHFVGDHADCIALFERLELKLLNVCVASSGHGGWRAVARVFKSLADAYPERYAWCTTVDPPDPADPEYAERAIASLEKDFQAGAVACKFWKNIGMEIRKPGGEFLLIDDPLLDPLYDYLERVGKPALMHIGEPLACWQPLDERDPHYGYYSTHPQWHMHNKPEYPSHKELMDARDRVLAKHPKLRVIGAHLGSLEYDVAELAKRLDRYPNFAVDTSARVRDLAHQDAETVRAFFLAYADRLLFGTDIVQREPHSALSDEERTSQLRSLQERFQAEFAYYETAQTVALRGREYPGLGLPSHVLDKFYHANAQAWYSGV